MSLSRISKQFAATLALPQVWGFIVSAVAIALIAIAFFYPDAQMGNDLRQHDMQQGAANGYEAQAFREATGQDSWWTNSLFSGMPMFQISPSYPSDSLYSWITTVYGAGLPSPSNLIFMMMFGFLILMAAMKVRWYYGLIGAVAWGFSTYFIIIIGAGHIWKFVTLAYIPPTIAGMVLAYRGRYLAGSAMAALFAMLQIHNNHVQMSYYFLFVMLGMAIAFFFSAKKEGKVRTWIVATASLVLAGVLAVCANLPSLYNTYEYSKQTIRGNHSELASASDPAQATGGLDRDYITQYSYGRSETFSLLIPNVKGGASAKPVQGRMVATTVASLPDAEQIMSDNHLNDYERQYVDAYVGQYFGEPEGTNGPIYVGAIIFALFVLGLIIVKGPMKWTLLALTLLSVFLALGRNMQWFTDLFIDYVPMYSKFRTVESILVIAEFTIPLLAILALQKLLTDPDGIKKYRTPLYIAFGASAFFCVLGWLFPSVYGSALNQSDFHISEMIGWQLTQQGYPRDVVRMLSIDNPAIASTVEQLRYSMVKDDSLRSLAFILLAFGALMLPVFAKAKAWQSAALVGILVFVDLYTVNKRYIDHDSFCTPEVSAADPFPLSAADRYILQDTAMNYRVMDIPRFQSAAPSRHHKAIGGYHAAKLTRYQDLIDRHLSNFLNGSYTDQDFRILDMLNARYIVTPDGQVEINPEALGNAWFVDQITYVDTPDNEMDALSSIMPASQAVADKKFVPILGDAAPKLPGDTIFETTYAPNRLTYKSRSSADAIAVFSEVYFPWGWTATIDGQPAEIGRVNYVLRALRVPAGEHVIDMRFEPQSVDHTVAIARIAIWIIYLAIAASILLLIIGLCRSNR